MRRRDRHGLPVLGLLYCYAVACTLATLVVCVLWAKARGWL